MTEREFALYEALKILMIEVIGSGLVDYSKARRRFEVRQQIFREHGMTNAAAIIGTLICAVEPALQAEAQGQSPLTLSPMDDVQFVQN